MKTRFRMPQLLLGFCGLFFVLSFGLASADENSVTPTGNDPDFIGKAYSLKNNALVYTEFHFVDDESKKHFVVYKDKNESIIAEKYLVFTDKKIEPEVKQKNFLCGEEIIVKGDQLGLTDLSYKADFSAAKENKTFNNPDDIVIDAGFNWLVEENWNEILAGEKIEFEFLAPSQLKQYPFVAKAENCAAFENLEDNSEIKCFSITPKKWWLKLVLDPIELAYLSNGRKLVGFKGMGNIADHQCKYMEVDIRYQY